MNFSSVLLFFTSSANLIVHTIIFFLGKFFVSTNHFLCARCLLILLGYIFQKSVKSESYLSTLDISISFVFSFVLLVMGVRTGRTLVSVPKLTLYKLLVPALCITVIKPSSVNCLRHLLIVLSETPTSSPKCFSLG